MYFTGLILWSILTWSGLWFNSCSISARILSYIGEWFTSDRRFESLLTTEIEQPDLTRILEWFIYWATLDYLFVYWSFSYLEIAYSSAREAASRHICTLYNDKSPKVVVLSHEMMQCDIRMTWHKLKKFLSSCVRAVLLLPMIYGISSSSEILHEILSALNDVVGLIQSQVGTDRQLPLRWELPPEHTLDRGTSTS